MWPSNYENVGYNDFYKLPKKKRLFNFLQIKISHKNRPEKSLNTYGRETESCFKDGKGKNHTLFAKKVNTMLTSATLLPRLPAFMDRLDMLLVSPVSP